MIWNLVSKQPHLGTLLNRATAVGPQNWESWFKTAKITDAFKQGNCHWATKLGILDLVYPRKPLQIKVKLAEP